MTALSTLVDSLKRELAVPGTFDDIFPDSGYNDLLGALADGFAEAQLNDFFSDTTLTFQPEGEGGEPSDWVTDPDLSLAAGALIVIFTSMRFLRGQLRATSASQRYKAGPVEFETSTSASLLKGELDYLQSRLSNLIEQAQESARPLAAVYDNYLARNASMLCGGFYAHEYK